MASEEDIEREDREIEALLRSAAPREQPPDALADRWEAHFRAELAETRRSRQHRSWQIAGACAVLVLGVLFAFTALLDPSPADDKVTVALVSQLRGDDVLIDGVVQKLAGGAVREGERLVTGSGSFVALEHRGYDLRLKGTSALRFQNDALHLERGELYISSSVDSTGLLVKTPHGSISDIGTQFIVAVDDDRASARVRTGRIRVSNNAGVFEARGSAQRAIELRFTASADPMRHEIAPRGVGWDWIYEEAPAFEVHGKSVFEFLTWASAEAGQTLHFANAEAERYARDTELRGDFPRPDPRRSVARILETTDLQLDETSDGVLRVVLSSSAAF